MFAVITRSVRFFVAPSPLTHFSIKYPKCLLTLNTIIGVQVRVAIIKANFFPCSFQLFITCVLKKIAKAVFLSNDCQDGRRSKRQYACTYFQQFFGSLIHCTHPFKEIVLPNHRFFKNGGKKNAHKIE